MASKKLVKMNKTELINLAVSYGVIDKAEALAVENKRKDGPTNADYLAALEPFKAKIDGTTDEDTEVQNIVVPDMPKVADDKANADVLNAKPLSGHELQQAKIDDLFVSIPVIATDHDNSQDIENAELGMGNDFAWGNPVIGMMKEKVWNHGRVQNLYKGTIKHINKLTIREKGGKGKQDIVRKRFTITEVPEEGFTQPQLDALAAKQAAQV